MDWGQLLNPGSLSGLLLPIAVGIVIIIILYFFRRLLYNFIHELVVKTRTCFDDILIQETRAATLLWCIWLGVFAGFTVYSAPETWSVITDKVIPVLFVALGIYTVIMIILASLKWYKKEICPKIRNSLDDFIVIALIYTVPLVGGVLGIIQILNMLDIRSQIVNDWLSAHLGTLMFIVTLAVTLLLVVVIIVPKIIHAAVRGQNGKQTEDELQKREDTLVSVVVTSFQIVIIIIFVLMFILHLVDWKVITPILTATGVVGVAIGFGAQSLVKDVLAGLFIIMENQYRKGDVVRIADTSGVVEEISLRRTILRDLDGITHVVPNGEIRVASNFTKLWSRANLNINVSYDTDLDKAMAVINRVGKEMAEDPQWSPLILTPPKAVRVDKLGESGIEIKVLGDTKPIKQWDVMGELRLRIKKAFDEEGIEIPWPHTKVYFGNMPPDLHHHSFEEKSEDKKPAPKKNN